jgi:VWFA-related protein
MRLLVRWMVRWMVAGVVSVPLVLAQDATTGGPTLQVAKPGAADANVVVLAVVVRDKKGALVNGLTKNDFALQVKGKSQDISYVDHGNDVPLTLGVVVDVRDGQQSKVEEERADTKGFLQAVLTPASGKREADKAFAVHFAKEIELLQDVTDQRPLLDKAVDELGTTSASFHTVDAPDTVDSEGRKERHGGTSLYDAVYLSTEELMAKQKGRKVLVVVTDGVDVGSKESLTEVLESAQEANTVVYAVYTKGQQHFDQQMGNPNRRTSGGYPGGGYPGGGYPGGGYPGGGYPGGGSPGGGSPGGGSRNPNGNGGPGGSSRKPSVDGRQVMERICGETGGRVFEVSKKQTVAEIYAQIAEEVKAEYQLRFTPDAAGLRYGLHPIDLNMSNAEMNKKVDIQTRSGYYGVPSE